MTSPILDHIARAQAQALYDDLAPIKEALERHGVTLRLELIHGHNLAGVALGVVVKGTLEAARKRAALLQAMARSRGVELEGGVIELFRDGLAPDEWDIALHRIRLCRTRAPRRKAA